MSGQRNTNTNAPASSRPSFLESGPSSSSSSSTIRRSQPNPNPISQPRPTQPQRPPPRRFQWSRPIKFAFRPKTVIFFVLPGAFVLSWLDPLGVNDQIQAKIEEKLQTQQGEQSVYANVPEPTMSRPIKSPDQVTPVAPSQPVVQPVEAVPIEGKEQQATSEQPKSRIAPWNSWFNRAGNTQSTPNPDLPPSITGNQSQPQARSQGHTQSVLGIESSADDSCCAIVDSDRKIRSSVVIKQHEMNAEYGGIHPLQAQKLHAVNVPRAIAQALREADMKVEDLDAIAYTRGPGMQGCLLYCATAAKALAAAHGIPLLGIHHMQAHALTPLLTETPAPKFPFLVLLVSGGHTQLVLARSLHEYRIIADCLDSKIGDAFDKVARLLQLPTSSQASGAILEEFASRPPLPPYDFTPLKALTVPLSAGSGKKSLQFSFSGLVTDIDRTIRRLVPSQSTTLRGRNENRSDSDREQQEIDAVLSENSPYVNEALQREISRRFQDAAFTHLTQKLQLAFSLRHLADVRGVVVSGGVASNVTLREKLRCTLRNVNPEIKLYYPPISLCTDNAAMIAWTGILRLQDGAEDEGFGLPLRPKWSLEDLYDDVPHSIV